MFLAVLLSEVELALFFKGAKVLSLVDLCQERETVNKVCNANFSNNLNCTFF